MLSLPARPVFRDVALNLLLLLSAVLAAITGIGGPARAAVQPSQIEARADAVAALADTAVAQAGDIAAGRPLNSAPAARILIPAALTLGDLRTTIRGERRAE